MLLVRALRRFGLLERIRVRSQGSGPTRSTGSVDATRPEVHSRVVFVAVVRLFELLLFAYLSSQQPDDAPTVPVGVVERLVAPRAVPLQALANLWRRHYRVSLEHVFDRVARVALARAVGEVPCELAIEVEVVRRRLLVDVQVDVLLDPLCVMLGLLGEYVGVALVGVELLDDVVDPHW